MAFAILGKVTASLFGCASRVCGGAPRPSPAPIERVSGCKRAFPRWTRDAPFRNSPYPTSTRPRIEFYPL
ncbi:hypothetical protein RU639_010340 [Aspergillus parasiticus]